MDKQSLLPWGAFYTLGPLTATLTGYDHHLGHWRGNDRQFGRHAVLRGSKDTSVCRTRRTKDGVITYKIAAHVRPRQRGHPGPYLG